MRPSGRLAVEQLSSLCTARKGSRGNRVRVDGAGSGEASDRRRGEDIADPRLAPKSGARTWATLPFAQPAKGGAPRSGYGIYFRRSGGRVRHPPITAIT